MSYVNMIETDLAALVVVDVQQKMLSAIGSGEPDRIVNRIETLIAAARLFEMPIILTEQYPQGLGPTDERIMRALPEGCRPVVKTTCSTWRDDPFRKALRETSREHVIVAGLETHVCIQQTVLDLMRVDYLPFVPLDAVGSRNAVDHETAISRMSRAGAEITTTESLIFELVERCDHPKFKEVLKLVK